MKLILLFTLCISHALAQDLTEARKEGEVMLYTSLVPEDLTALGAAFEKKHGVKLKSWRANSEKVLQPLRSPHLNMFVQSYNTS